MSAGRWGPLWFFSALSEGKISNRNCEQAKLEMTRLETPFPLEGSAAVETPGVQAHRFKDALARLAGGLAIITCLRDGRAHGLLVNSITGLSVDPPRFLFCVRREASAHDALVGAQLCGVSILSAEDEPEAQTFIDPSLRALRFTDPRWLSAPGRPPVLSSGLSTSTCQIDSVTNAGSHSILAAPDIPQGGTTLHPVVRAPAAHQSSHPSTW